MSYQDVNTVTFPMSPIGPRKVHGYPEELMDFRLDLTGQFAESRPFKHDQF